MKYIILQFGVKIVGSIPFPLHDQEDLAIESFVAEAQGLVGQEFEGMEIKSVQLCSTSDEPLFQ